MHIINNYIKETRELAFQHKYKAVEEKLRILLMDINSLDELMYLMQSNLHKPEMDFIVNQNDIINLVNKKGENFLFLLNSHKILMIDNIPDHMYKKLNDLNQNLLFTTHSSDVYKLFFEKGLNPNHQDKKGHFPIYKLLKQRQSLDFEVNIQLFLDNGFDVTLENKKGLKFLDFITSNNNEKEASDTLWSLRNIIVKNKIDLPEKAIDLIMSKFAELKKYNLIMDVPLLPYTESIMLKKSITVLDEDNLKRRL